MPKYQVFYNGIPAEYKEGEHEYRGEWDLLPDLSWIYSANSKFDSLDKAIDYATEWVGNYSTRPNEKEWPDEIRKLFLDGYAYNGVDVIQIKEITLTVTNEADQYVLLLKPDTFLGYSDASFYETNFHSAYKFPKAHCEGIKKQYYPESMMYKIVSTNLELVS